MLYGHKNPIPAPGVPGECYSLLGKILDLSFCLKVIIKGIRYQHHLTNQLFINSISLRGFVNNKIKIVLLVKCGCHNFNFDDVLNLIL